MRSWWAERQMVNPEWREVGGVKRSDGHGYAACDRCGTHLLVFEAARVSGEEG